MKIKNKLMINLCLVIFISIYGIIWWNVPSSLTNIEPYDVSKIEIFDGNTGTAITITKISDIEHIINNLNSVNLKKEAVSLGRMGYSFKTTIYKANGKVYRKFIINSTDTIRNDPFFL